MRAIFCWVFDRSVGFIASFVTYNQSAFKAALNAVVAAELALDDPEDLTERQWLKRAPTHTKVRTAGPLVIDRGPELLLPLPRDRD
jgi:hypothetical protein